jgi:hypothetical protein
MGLKENSHELIASSDQNRPPQDNRYEYVITTGLYCVPIFRYTSYLTKAQVHFSVKTQLGIHELWVGRIDGKWIASDEGVYFGKNRIYYNTYGPHCPWGSTAITSAVVTIHDSIPGMFNDEKRVLVNIWNDNTPLDISANDHHYGFLIPCSPINSEDTLETPTLLTALTRASGNVKPNLFGGFVSTQSDWLETSSEYPSFIKSKPPFVPTYPTGSGIPTSPSPTRAANTAGYRIVEDNFWMTKYGTTIDTTGAPSDYFFYYGLDAQTSVKIHKNNSISTFLQPVTFENNVKGNGLFEQNNIANFKNTLIISNKKVNTSLQSSKTIIRNDIEFGDDVEDGLAAVTTSFIIKKTVGTSFQGNVSIVSDGIANSFSVDVPTIFSSTSVQFNNPSALIEFSSIPTCPTAIIPDFNP